ncbi:MAG: RNA-binding domain-containing protein [Candidatus Njordarchaeales archaeon]
MPIKVRLQCTVNPTENEEKVLRALKNISDFEENVNMKRKSREYFVDIVIEGDLSILRKLRNKIKGRSRDLARMLLFKNRVGKRTYLLINKQVAYVGKISFCETRNESPLGPIVIEIIGDSEDEIDSMVAWIVQENKEFEIEI